MENMHWCHFNFIQKVTIRLISHIRNISPMWPLWRMYLFQLFDCKSIHCVGTFLVFIMTGCISFPCLCRCNYLHISHRKTEYYKQYVFLLLNFNSKTVDNHLFFHVYFIIVTLRISHLYICKTTKKHIFRGQLSMILIRKLTKNWNIFLHLYYSCDYSLQQTEASVLYWRMFCKYNLKEGMQQKTLLNIFENIARN